MQQSLAQLLYDISGNVADWSHAVPNQMAIAIVVTIGLIMCVLSVVFPLRSNEPDWQADVAPWPLAREVPTIRGQMDGGESDTSAVNQLFSHGEEF